MNGGHSAHTCNAFMMLTSGAKALEEGELCPVAALSSLVFMSSDELFAGFVASVADPRPYGRTLGKCGCPGGVTTRGCVPQSLQSAPSRHTMHRLPLSVTLPQYSQCVRKHA